VAAVALLLTVTAGILVLGALARALKTR